LKSLDLKFCYGLGLGLECIGLELGLVSFGLDYNTGPDTESIENILLQTKQIIFKQKDVHGMVDNKLINASSCIASQCALLYYFTRYAYRQIILLDKGRVLIE
jgi:hypothetical protein